MLVCWVVCVESGQGADRDPKIRFMKLMCLGKLFSRVSLAPGRGRVAHERHHIAGLKLLILIPSRVVVDALADEFCILRICKVLHDVVGNEVVGLRVIDGLKLPDRIVAAGVM